MKGYTAKLFGAVAAGMLLTALAPMLAFAGWNSSDGYWYMYEPGKVYCDQFAQIDGYVYSFDENGYMETGWIQDTNNELGHGPEAWCYADSSGALVDNQWVGNCFISDGVAITDDSLMAWINNEYYFDENGYWVPNEWYSYPDGWCLWLGNQEWAKDDVYSIDGAVYLFDVNGYMLTNEWYNYYGDWYYFGADGKMARDQWVDGVHYVDMLGERVENGYSPDGYTITGGAWDGNGKAFTWKQSSNGKWKAVFNDGTFPAGSLLKLSHDYYYFGLDGYLVTGWFMVANDGVWHYSDSTGRMFGDKWLDGTYYFDEQLAMATNAKVSALSDLFASYVDENGKYDKYATKWVHHLVS